MVRLSMACLTQRFACSVKIIFIVFVCGPRKAQLGHSVTARPILIVEVGTAVLHGSSNVIQ